ncbi:hypothetical protein ACHAW5_001839 [Stephanodiscus triporus]|uniref:SET domain-containing protein n=1 Tax=Stephanodiscus triporus TaxID=2934178 RepID=A0ABD3MLT0_9STRA
MAKTKKKKATSGAVRNRQSSSSSSPSSSAVVPLAVVKEWLETRKIKVPDALLVAFEGGDGRRGVASSSSSSFASVDDVLRHLPSLRERERRALVRRVERTTAPRATTTTTTTNDPELNDDADDDCGVRSGGSDGEYCDDVENESSTPGVVVGWPTDVEFSNEYRWDVGVPPAIRDRYFPKSTRRRLRPPRQSDKVYFRRINDPDHPAHGQYGLFCALDRAPPGTWLLDYVGVVTLGEDQDMSSDYVCDFGENGELACDANVYGNESRFLNDFRNTGRHPNVEFNLRRDARSGELRQGVYVKRANEAREEGFDGVRRDEELLVSYGKSYWRSRVGNLTDFIWRLPGRPMPEGGRPSIDSCNERR